MQSWVNFWNIIFWLSLVGFLVNLENFFKILLYSEIVWAILYTYVVVLGSVNNDLSVLGTSFYILALAGLEFSVGILLLITFKNNNKSLNLNSDDKNSKIINEKKIKSTKIYWNFK